MVLRKSYLDKIIPFIDQDLIKVLVGIRRCGKTVLLGQIKDVLLQRNIPAQNIIQANFESMRFRNTRTAETLYDYIAEKAEGCTGKIYILLDEIQEVERWQIAINSLRVDFDCDIYLTGSNSKLLSGELATYLSGRYIQIQVFPFSLAEAKQQCIENGTYTSDEKLFADYLKYGGFPQRFFLPDDHSITTYLDDLYEAIIVRDIMLRHNIREQTALRNVLAFLLDNIGNPFSARNISGRMVSEGIKTTTATVLNYVDYFKEAFILLNAKEKRSCPAQKNTMQSILACGTLSRKAKNLTATSCMRTSYIWKCGAVAMKFRSASWTTPKLILSATVEMKSSIFRLLT